MKRSHERGLVWLIGVLLDACRPTVAQGRAISIGSGMAALTTFKHAALVNLTPPD